MPGAFTGIVASSRAVAAAFSPIDIAGLKLWLKADLLALVDGDPVGTWPDSSGNANNATQATSGFRPVYKTGIVNGLPAVKFDGVDDFMGFTPLTTIQSAFFVVKNLASGGNQPFAPILGGTSTFDWIGGGATTLLDSSFASANLISGSGYVNGVSTVVASIVRPLVFALLEVIAIGPTAANYLTQDRTNFNRNWDGYYAEVILYDSALGSTDRVKVENYLLAKYGL